ncbi:glycoside hydrolase superfamily [Entophlyctis helioformis]|nr:glycoside hydrolase superfamily [Entophlyctis helioformis]
MGLASIVLTLLVLAAVPVAAAAAAWVWLRRRNLGSLPVPTSAVAYDHDSFGHILTWDRHCFYLHGKPLVLLSGEFHYWRLPDHARWEEILLQYKAAGLNSIRIYFHWGFHSPSDGVYNFDGNKNLDFLLDLCEKHRIYVLAAPGPYICAETQGGGIPPWLIAKRDVLIRHTTVSMFRTYDAEFSRYSAQWYEAIMPILARHQVTSKPNGCVLALQIENEAFELFKGIPLGLSDDMRHLSKTARDLGMTVPLFTNDAWEEGSFVAREDSHTSAGKQTFGLDLYGFDKYVVFCPTSSPLATVGGDIKSTDTWGEWSTSDVTKAFDNTESTVRGFGGGAASSPILIAELQGGWFNHYTVPHTFDDVYNYYGEKYTRMIVDTAMSQGVTALNLYMFYGGTNWGTLGDPDVYTSYDYSACIREFGHLSGRGRQVRLSLAFARSFADIFSRTDPVGNSLRGAGFKIESSVPDFIARRRRTPGVNFVDFVFFRNFAPNKATATTISVTRGSNEPLQLKCRLPYKHSFIGVGNYAAVNGLRLLLATLPIHLRMRPADGSEVWIIQSDDEVDGQLAFYGHVTAEGSLNPTTREEGGVSVISFQNSIGWAKISAVGAPESIKPLIVIALPARDLYTLQPSFEDAHWRRTNEKLAALDASDDLPLAVFWGAYSAQFDPATRALKLEEESENSPAVYSIAVGALGALAGFASPDGDDPLAGAPFVTKLTRTPIPALQTALSSSLAIQLANVTTRKIDFADMPWQKIPIKDGNASTPTLNAIDYLYTSGHAVYKMEFNLKAVPNSNLRLDINLRHRGTLYLNGALVGGHITYSLGAFRAGAKNGPDVNTFGGWQTYSLPTLHLNQGANTLIVLTESLGLNRQPFVLNDVRCPRGILKAQFPTAMDATNSLKWHIAGVDVRKLEDIFNHSGLPGETTDAVNAAFVHATAEQVEFKADTGVNVFHAPPPTTAAAPAWFRSSFDLPAGLAATVSADGALRVPLRLHMTGTGTAYIYINGTFIARFYGNGDGPQKDFYVPERLLKVSGNTLQMLVYGDGGSNGSPTTVSTVRRDWVGLEFRFWKVKTAAAAGAAVAPLATSSGNLDDAAGKPFALHRSVLDL